MRAATFFLACMLAVGLAGAAGAEPASRTGLLTLAQAQAEARRQAPEGAALLAQVQGAEEISRAAGRLFRVDPSVYGSFKGALSAHLDEYAWEVGINLPVDVSGSFRLRGDAARADVQRVERERENGLRALDEVVAIAVADLAMAQRLAARSERIAELYQVTQQAARRDLELGHGNQLDVDAADLDAAAARSSAAEARGALQQAQIRLARLLGRASAVGLSVADPDELATPTGSVEVAALVERDPRVQAAAAELRAARLELAAAQRMTWPIPTLRLSYIGEQKDVPAGAFSGAPGVGGLTAAWSESLLSVGLTLPLPLFDRNRDQRARSQARILLAQARLDLARQDTSAELASAAAALHAAQEALAALSQTPAILEQEFSLLERATRAGALDAVARAVAVRRLEEAGRRLDAATRNLRAEHARWLRRTSGL